MWVELGYAYKGYTFVFVCMSKFENIWVCLTAIIHLLKLGGIEVDNELRIHIIPILICAEIKVKNEIKFSDFERRRAVAKSFHKC